MKNKKSIRCFALLIISVTISNILMAQSRKEKASFIKTSGTQFILDGKPYYYIGANFWAGMNLGSLDKTGNRARLVRELDKMSSLGINNLRIMALTEGPDSEPFRIVPSNNNKGVLNENYLIGLDFLLTEMKKRKMYAVICLSNFWPWSGGFAQYMQWTGAIDSIYYPMDITKDQNWDLYMTKTTDFYSLPKAVKMYKKSIAAIINRKNSITNIKYKNDPAIMSWELCNEPRGINNVKDYLKWIDNAAAFIKRQDNNHMVTVGSEGETTSKFYSGTPFEETHQSKNIDYTCAHLWIQNWNLYDPKNHDKTYLSAKLKSLEYIQHHAEMSYKLNKPFVLEEFGIMKDNGSYDYGATNEHRDEFYEFIFFQIHNLATTKKAAGVNFWAWGGEGRPRQSGCWWKVGDDFIGDPPHEQQGWYSVYDTDTSTHKVIAKYTALMKEISFIK